MAPTQSWARLNPSLSLHTGSAGFGVISDFLASLFAALPYLTVLRPDSGRIAHGMKHFVAGARPGHKQLHVAGAGRIQESGGARRRRLTDGKWREPETTRAGRCCCPWV